MKELTVSEAIELVVAMLEEVEVKGHENASRIVKSQEILSKVVELIQKKSEVKSDDQAD